MPTTLPTAGDVHVNSALTNFAQKYLQDDPTFVMHRAFPNMPVAHKSNTYHIFDKGDFFRDEAKERAPGTESAGGGFALSQDTYTATTRAFHKDISDEERANQDPSVNLELSSTQYVMQKMLISRERAIAATALATSGTWTTNVNGDWIAAASDPIADVRTAKRTVQGLTGLRPNRMLIGRQAYDTLTDNDALLSRITGGANNAMPAMVLRTLIANLLELDEIFVVDGIFNSAVRGATDSMSFIGGDTAVVYYAPQAANSSTASAGVQFSWTGALGNTANGIRIKRFRQENLESDRIEGQMSFDFKITGADLGYSFATVSA